MLMEWAETNSEMTNLFLVILSSAMFGITFAELSGIPQTIKKLILPWRHEKTINGSKLVRRLKPFDCHLCLSFWTCFAWSYSQLELPFIECVVMGCYAAVVSTGIMKLIR